MAIGFKRDGKFIPTGQKMVSKSRRSRVRYANGAGMDQILEQSIRDFASKRKEAYNNYRANQEAKFDKEIALRRKFQSRLIRAWRLANAQNIKSGRNLEKFIRAQIPELPKEKGIDKFVVNVLKDFKKQEEQLAKAKKGKGKEEQQALQKTFDKSLEDSETEFIKQQTEQDRLFRNEQNKIDGENEAKRKQARKEAEDAQTAEQKKTEDEINAKRKQKEAEVAEEIAKKDKEEADKKEKETQEAEAKAQQEQAEAQKQEEESAKREQMEAQAQRDKEEAEEAQEQQKVAERIEKESAEAEAKAQQEQAEAQKQAEQSAKQAEIEAKQETTFASEVAEELKQDKQDIKTEDFSFGFPEEIV